MQAPAEESNANIPKINSVKRLPKTIHEERNVEELKSESPVMSGQWTHAPPSPSKKGEYESVATMAQKSHEPIKDVTNFEEDIEAVAQPTLSTQTKSGQEFGIFNRQGHHNCFINVLLQAMWQIRSFRQTLIRFSYEEDDSEEGSKLEIAPLIYELKKFFKRVHIFTTNASQEENRPNALEMHESISIRRELFKLKYVNGEFVLHDKADAFEAFDFILTAIHNWEKKNGPPNACEFTEK